MTFRSRNKYTSVDEVRLSGLFFKYGLLVSICFSLFAFSWSTSVDEALPVVWDELYGDTEITPPITNFKKPKPLPPPPPQKKVIPLISEVLTDAPVFEDPVLETDVLADTNAISGPPSDVVPPPPPPPPIPEEEVDKVFITTEQMPRFPGCEDMIASFKEKESCSNSKLLEYLYANIKYPKIAKENGIEGTVVVRFTVNREGEIKDIKILRNPGAGLGKEATRVVNSMNNMDVNWIPGKQRGRPVSVLFTLPISFKLN